MPWFFIGTGLSEQDLKLTCTVSLQSVINFSLAFFVKEVVMIIKKELSACAMVSQNADIHLQILLFVRNRTSTD